MRVLSFFAVGLGMLLIAYIAPIPEPDLVKNNTFAFLIKLELTIKFNERRSLLGCNDYFKSGSRFSA